MAEKIIGYFLLFFGILIIILSAGGAFRVVLKKSSPPEFISSQVSPSSANFASNLLKENNQSISLIDALGFSRNDFTYIINLSIYLLLLSFLAKAGFHLASLGTMLVREIVVDLKAKNPSKLQAKSND